MRLKQQLFGYAMCFYCFCMGIPFSLIAQQNVDFSGHIIQYDSTFSGVGPKVYFLPPPKSAEELLDDRYADKEIDSTLVEEYVARMKYYHRMGITGEAAMISKYLPIAIAHAESVEGKLWLEIAYAEKLGRENLVADLENRLGMEYLATGAYDYALEFFEKAMATKRQNNQVSDWETIANNLAITYEYLGQLDKAHALRQDLYNRALKANNNSKQAHAMMELAMVKAKQGFSQEAEHEIIRKVVPLFRRARNEAGRAEAYRTLANIYNLQGKYPEAQWFLVQAKSIVDKEGIADQLTDIIFSLAENKKQAGNPRVAIEEYKVADDLARKGNIVGMQLAILDALGDLYHQAGNYSEAAVTLNRYDTLKNILFNGEAPIDN